MTLRIPENIPPHLKKLAKKLDTQIQALGRGEPPELVLDKDDMTILRRRGKDNYITHLKKIRMSLGQPESLSEE